MSNDSVVSIDSIINNLKVIAHIKFRWWLESYYSLYPEVYEVVWKTEYVCVTRQLPSIGTSEGFARASICEAAKPHSISCFDCIKFGKDELEAITKLIDYLDDEIERL